MIVSFIPANNILHLIKADILTTVYIVAFNRAYTTDLKLKTAILSWLQNDGSRGFSVDQFKGNNLRVL